VLLGRRISKGAQRSNWAVEELTEKQIRYAATDAWIGLRLFQEMKSRHLV
jgi:ribonuclease D